MKKITVYADFDFLASPQKIGILGYEHVRGKDHFVFEYSREWFKQHGGIMSHKILEPYCNRWDNL